MIGFWINRLRLGIKYYLYIIRNGQPERCNKKSVAKFDWCGDGRMGYVCEEHLNMRKGMVQHQGFSGMDFTPLNMNTKKRCREQLAMADYYQES